MSNYGPYKREIKFRAWCKRDGAMLDWLTMSQTAFNRDDQYSLLYNILVNHKDYYEVMQFTGLLDKNGKEIYEGDILKSFSSSIPAYEVFYERGCYRLRYKLKSGDYYDWGPSYRMEEISQERESKMYPEVIGNCYQNPELLTQPLPKE